MRVTLVIIAALACSSCDSGGSGNQPGAPDHVQDGKLDDCAESPLAASCLQDETHSIFVSPDGSDVLGIGSRARPVKTIAHAFTLLTPDKRRVYLCGAEYKEDLVLGLAHAALVLTGGLDCSWKPNGGRAKVGTDGWPFKPIQVGAAEAPIVLDGIEAVTPAPTSPATGDPEPLYALTVSGGTLVIRHSRFVAPVGRRGADGMAGSPHNDSRHSRGPFGSMGGNTACWTGIGQSNGGNAPGQSGTPGGTANGGASGVACEAGGDGQVGAAGADAVGSGAGATDVGVLSSYNSAPLWRPGTGSAGPDGTVGQGGGGGGTGPAPTGLTLGGGGGYGGCGARGGAGGAGGKESVAILAFETRLVIRDSVLETGGGGEGGAGGLGGKGDEGLGGAAGTAGGCKGGNGGPGGASGPGGGGPGGISIGVLYTGTAPDLDDATRTATESKLGPAGKGGKGPVGNNGIDGVRAVVLEAKRAPVP